MLKKHNEYNTIPLCTTPPRPPHKTLRSQNLPGQNPPKQNPRTKTSSAKAPIKIPKDKPPPPKKKSQNPPPKLTGQNLPANRKNIVN